MIPKGKYVRLAKSTQDFANQMREIWRDFQSKIPSSNPIIMGGILQISSAGGEFHLMHSKQWRS